MGVTVRRSAGGEVAVRRDRHVARAPSHRATVASSSASSAATCAVSTPSSANAPWHAQHAGLPVGLQVDPGDERSPSRNGST